MTLQQLFIANLKKARKERGFSQMALSERCDSNSNYIGQIEMGRRIPSFEKIEKIAAALEIPSHALFAAEPVEKKDEKKLKAKDYLQRMPANIKREITSRMAARIKNNIEISLDPQNY
ncbi:MAG: helix-turn-helix domain-containing protein [Treponema sp.]|jgi:transcriptional regulator with XRE-family HTH domain|nr:helix-turn-helix domain-containing protein [Treponema sp.]